MSWFITKGSPVTEDRAFIRKYHKVWKVSDGTRQAVAQDILMFADPDEKGAPIYKDGADVKHLARLTADLSCIPVAELMQKMGKDGNWYCMFLSLLLSPLSLPSPSPFLMTTAIDTTNTIPHRCNLLRNRNDILQRADQIHTGLQAGQIRQRHGGICLIAARVRYLRRRELNLGRRESVSIAFHDISSIFLNDIQFNSCHTIALITNETTILPTRSIPLLGVTPSLQRPPKCQAALDYRFSSRQNKAALDLQALLKTMMRRYCSSYLAIGLLCPLNP